MRTGSAALLERAARGWRVKRGCQSGNDAEGHVLIQFGPRPQAVGWCVVSQGHSPWCARCGGSRPAQPGPPASCPESNNSIQRRSHVTVPPTRIHARCVATTANHPTRLQAKTKPSPLPPAAPSTRGSAAASPAKDVGRVLDEFGAGAKRSR